MWFKLFLLLTMFHLIIFSDKYLWNGWNRQKFSCQTFSIEADERRRCCCNIHWCQVSLAFSLDTVRNFVVARSDFNLRRYGWASWDFIFRVKRWCSFEPSLYEILVSWIYEPTFSNVKHAGLVLDVVVKEEIVSVI